MERVEGPEKVTGRALYAAEHRLEGLVHAVPVLSTVAAGEILGIDDGPALALEGVLTVLTHWNATRLRRVDDRELAVLQSTIVSYRGQIVAAVVAESPELAREAAGLVRVEYRTDPHAVELRVGDPRLYRPAHVNPHYETDSARGDFERAYADAAITIDRTYRTPAVHHNALEPHATVAVWGDGRLTLYDSNQGSTAVRDTVAEAFGLEPGQVRVITHHVGGGFGGKGTVRPQAVLAALAAWATGRPVKVAVTRQQMFAFVGYRTPTIQRVRLGADGGGRLVAIAHDVVEQTSTVREFAEQTAVATRMMYAAPHRRTTHRLAALDVPTPSWMRAPGECPGMFALESAMDELAIACGLDPIELRTRNEPDADPEARLPFSSRALVACLRDGAERFGWRDRDPTPAARRVGRCLVGTGVAASTYPAGRRPSAAIARVDLAGNYSVLVNATDIGTGARTALTLIAADALAVTPDRVRMEIGDSDLPAAPLAGGSMGTASWGTAVASACRRLRVKLEEHDLVVPATGLEDRK